MPRDLKLERAEFSLYLWRVEESVEQLESMASGYTASCRYRAITSEARRREWLSSKVLYQQLSVEGDISYSDIGAPVIPNGHISISHSGDYVALLYSKTRVCGVDIERLDRRFDRVATRFLSEQERLLCHKRARDIGVDLNQIYGICWSIKEAVYKTLARTDIEFSEDIVITNLDESSSLVEVDGSIITLSIVAYNGMTISIALR